MLEQSKVDKMNNVIADYIIKRVEILSPLAAPSELSTIAKLARVVNDAPKTISMTGVAIGGPLKPYKRKKRKKYK